jgi:hypothetical protein
MKKGLGEKVLGWFVVEEGADAGAVVDEAPAVEAPAVPMPMPVPMHMPMTVPGVPDEERARLATVLSLIESLPDEASLEVKRTIVGASLEAFGISIEGILVSGERALSALDSQVSRAQSRTRDVLGQAESRIAKLTSEIEEVRRSMDAEVTAQQESARAVATEKARVGAVLDFFGASARVAPPRLVRLK